MISKIVMPQGGQDLTTGRIVRWLVKEGSAVKKGDVLGEVETEKAVFEVSAPLDGVLLKIVALEGEEVAVLSTIAYVGEPGDPLPIDSAQSSDKKVESRRSLPTSDHGSGSSKRKTGEFKITPKARKLAREHNISLVDNSKFVGKDIIRSADIEEIINNQKISSDVPGENRRSFTRIQKIAAQRLTKSWTTAPHIFVSRAVDMTGALGFRKSKPELNISINDMVLRAVALALKSFPMINVSYHDNESFTQWKEINISIAVATDEGLQVAVVEHADEIGLERLGDVTRVLIDQVIADKKPPTKTSRFTISNLGMFDVDNFTAVINPPEAAILAVSSIQKKPAVKDGSIIEVREFMNITLSLDHRVGDGVLAAKFINAIKDLLESPERL